MPTTNRADFSSYSTILPTAIIAALIASNGDFHATVARCARFCTEALVDAAMAVWVPTNFAAALPTYRTATRDEALMRLASLTNYARVMAWGVNHRAEQTAKATAEATATAYSME